MVEGLIPYCLDEKVEIRHGALYGIAEMLIGLAGKGHLNNMKNEMKDSVFL